jgi:uncharacterized protein YyaL (SSP411 family)
MRLNILGVKMSFNRLKDEKSAYLKQHAKNPVHWWSYGPEALQKAKDENKPILLSIGYSSCHYCHLMNEESFQDQTTAEFMNKNFINIKVDREELSDMDQYFQLACQVTSGKGGWPLNAFLTPDFNPYFIGTYFPKTATKDVPSFMDVAQNLKAAFYDENETVLKNAKDIVEAISQPPQVAEKVEFEGHFPGPAGILNAIKDYQDNEEGGYGAEPKFPQFAFYEWAIEHILEGMIPEENGKHIIHSIERMLMGGLYDHARGGIHRYSTDKKWKVPHFEKMLYDQAGLLKLLAKTTLIYPSPLIFDSIIQTLDYLKAEMFSEEGYFFSAQDADSEGVEGLYFTFTKDEFIDALISYDENLSDNMETILKWFDISEKGNFEKNLNIISLNSDFKEDFYSPDGWTTVRTVRQALAEARKMRIPPATDNKGVASWNFQMVSALIDVVQYCKVDSIALQARELLNEVIMPIHKTFIKTINGKSKMISTTTKEEHVPLFEDYVMFCESQLRFYELSGNTGFKDTGIQTIDFILKEFFDDDKVYTRALSFTDSHLYSNIHAPIFDQSYKSPLGVFIGLIRKWKALDGQANNGEERLEKIRKISETLTHLSLQNPLMFGETLRALVYPDEAYRSIEVPISWLKKNIFSRYYPHFSVRFALNFVDEETEKWSISTYKEVEISGSSLLEFEEIFDVKPE